MSSAATALQAQQLQAALQQVASSGALAGTSLLPGLLQGGSPSSSNGDLISSQLSVMLPAQQQVGEAVIKCLSMCFRDCHRKRGNLPQGVISVFPD